MTRLRSLQSIKGVAARTLLLQAAKTTARYSLGQFRISRLELYSGRSSSPCSSMEASANPNSKCSRQLSSEQSADLGPRRAGTRTVAHPSEGTGVPETRNPKPESGFLTVCGCGSAMLPPRGLGKVQAEGGRYHFGFKWVSVLSGTSLWDRLQF